MELNPRKTYGVSHGIRTGKFLLSIQGSAGHYCTPREDGLFLNDFYSLELLIFKDDRTYDIWKCKEIKEFPKYKELMSYNNYQPPSHPLGWVPIELINKLYLHLKTYTK